MAANPETVLSEQSIRFYRHALAILADAEVPHLVGGAYALARYTGIERHTKDFDLFIRREDFGRAAWAFQKAGYKTELTFPHWLGKAWKGEDFVDLIFSAGNGVAAVDDLWFEHGVRERVFGVEVDLIPAEEMIWSKGLIMERERFDGADVAHMILKRHEEIDWRRLLAHMEMYWEVLLIAVLNFRFIYPSERDLIPRWLFDELIDRLQAQAELPASGVKICRGRLLSPTDFVVDVSEWGFADVVGKGLAERHDPIK